MDDWAIVAIISIIFGTLYSMVRTIVGGAGRRNKARTELDEGESHSQRELFDLAMRLQNRVETLERLLDSSQPEWRGK